jgi:hypothetical protein
MLEFDTGIFSCEVPVGFGVILIAVALPSRDRKKVSKKIQRGTEV